MPPFLSTPSARRATSTPNSVRCCCTNFYPRPPRGGRHELRLISGCRFLFLSTPSARRATHRCAGGLNVQADFYPRPPRGGRRSRLDAVPPAGIFLSTPSARRATLCRVLHRQAGRISIHALREEGDQGPRSEAGHRTDFYPRPPRGGRRVRFLRSSQRHNFYPRPPRGGRHRSDMAQAATIQFLSTPSARRATRVETVVGGGQGISIHALREEGDPQSWFYVEDVRYFYPRPPRGGRRGIPDNHATLLYFYPRPPRGGRPQQRAAAAAMVGFLSTPSARRATRPSQPSDGTPWHFYPRPPRGGRHEWS